MSKSPEDHALPTANARMHYQIAPSLLGKIVEKSLKESDMPVCIVCSQMWRIIVHYKLNHGVYILKKKRSRIFVYSD